MVNMPIPPSAKYIPVSLVFTALFNNPSIGQYSFNTALNRGKELLKFQPNSWYYLDAVSIGGTISELDYCNSVFSIPTLILKKSISGERVYSRALTIPKYAENRALSVFCNSDKGRPQKPGGTEIPDLLIADLEGVLNQIPATVGIASISLEFALSIFQMDEAGYNEAMRQPTEKSFSQKLRV